MALVMFDGVNAADCPGGGDVYAGYVNGSWPSYNDMVARFPAALHVSIAVNSSADAQVLDVENGDATPADVPGWVNRQRALGQVRPTIYCSKEGPWQDCINTCAAAGIAQPDYWIADWTNAPHTLPGAAAVQWTSTPGYDESLINDPTWPLSALPPVPPAPFPEGPAMLTPGQTLHEGESLVSGEFYLELQTDGNMVIYHQPAGQNPVAVRSSKTAHGVDGPGPFFLVMQEDGNCVLYNATTPNPTAIWASGTSGPNGFAVMQSDGNFCVYNQKCGWASANSWS